MADSVNAFNVCEEFIQDSTLNPQINFGRFRELNRDGQRLILDWFDRAWQKRRAVGVNCVEPFIHAWLAFNAWAACVTEFDHDWQWKQALSCSSRLSDKFDEMLAASESEFNPIAKRFYDLWPIFKSQEIRRKGVYYSGPPVRKRVIEYYFDAEIEHFEPQCWARHRDAGEEIPLDWPHTLAALYRVRCNLFHGEKAMHSDNDRIIVASAFRVLVHFMAGSGILVNRS